MTNIWLHRYSILLAACTLFLVVAGASVTSNEAGLSVPDWPLSYGKLMPEMEGGIFYEHGHRMVATTVGFLTIILAVWLWRADDRSWMRKFGWAALAAVIAQGILGGLTVIFLLPKLVSISHASLAQLFFSAICAVALFTSPGWRRGPETIDDNPGVSLRTLALLVPLAVLAQLALGAAYRHKALDLVPHVIGATAVTGLILFAVVRVLLHCPRHTAIRQAALALLAIAFFQVFLGVAAYMSRVVTAEAPQPMPVMVWFTVLHVAVGALTMASSVILAIQVVRNVRRPAVEAHAGSAAVARP
jgi:heme a synthase